jgi:transcriptional regulator with XRE-family HTH domain
VPAVRHDVIRNELLGDLSEDGRRQYEAFRAVHEARQMTARLVELREAANLSQRQAAKRAGVDQADLSRIESGQVTPSLPTLLRLLDTVGATLIVARRRSASRANEDMQNVGRPRAAAGIPVSQEGRSELRPGRGQRDRSRRHDDQPDS